MKRILWIAVLTFFLGFTGHAQNYTFEVAGVVMDHSNPVPVPVPYQAVNIMVDSMGNSFFYQNTVYTDSNGYFQDFITLPPAVNMAIVTVSTFDPCLGYYQSLTGMWGGGATLPPFDFFLCENFPPGCMAMFYWDYDPAGGLDVYFYDMSFGNYTNWLWDFGDGNTSTEPNPTHTYAEAGSYQVCLTIFDDSNSCYNTACQEVWIATYPTFSVFGYVYLGNGAVADDATVRLMATDSVWLNVIEVASTTINEYGFYRFDSVSMSNCRLHFVQAELNEGSSVYGQYLPTYHLNALTWQEAMPVMPMSSWTFDVFLIEGNALNSGNGVITGNVTSLGAREVLEGVQVMLMSETMEPYIYARSDHNGEFRFDGLAYGNYMIYAEVIGLEANPALITLNEEQPAASVEIQVSGEETNIVFSVSDHFRQLSMVGESYPNPTRGHASLEITAQWPVQLRLDLYTQTGQRAWSDAVDLTAGSHRISLPMETLPPGFYFLRATSPEGDFVSRKLVKSN